MSQDYAYEWFTNFETSQDTLLSYLDPVFDIFLSLQYVKGEAQFVTVRTDGTPIVDAIH